MKLIKEFLKKFQTLYCKYPFKKNGKLIFIPKNFNLFLCFIKNVQYILKFNLNIFFNRNREQHEKKILMLKELQTNNNYNVYIDKNNIYIYNKNIKNITDKLFITIFLIDKKKDYFLNLTDKKYEDYTEIYRYIIHYIIYRNINNPNNIKDNSIFVRIFYEIYIFNIKVDINNFSNYRELYKYLKKEGIVDYYYNVLVPTIKSEYKKIYKNIISDNSYIKFKEKEMKKIISFKDVDLKNIIIK